MFWPVIYRSIDGPALFTYQTTINEAVVGARRKALPVQRAR